MQGHSLTIAFHKSEMVISTRKRIDRIMHMRVGDVEITSISAIRYLGVVIHALFGNISLKELAKG